MGVSKCLLRIWINFGTVNFTPGPETKYKMYNVQVQRQIVHIQQVAQFKNYLLVYLKSKHDPDIRKRVEFSKYVK